MLPKEQAGPSSVSFLTMRTELKGYNDYDQRVSTFHCLLNDEIRFDVSMKKSYDNNLSALEIIFNGYKLQLIITKQLVSKISGTK